MTLTLSGFLAVPAHATDGPGTIEICKSSKNGMTGQSFQFSLNGAPAITVKGGACSGPLVAPAGNNTVVESPTVGLEVKKIKANHKVSLDPVSGTAVVKVKAGSTAADETLVTFINRPLPAIGLKVCKQTPDPTLLGDNFSFQENGAAAYSVPAGPIGSPNCGPVTHYQLGTIVNIAELPVANTFVSSISVTDARGSNVNTAAGTVTATIGAGVTIVTYTNNVSPIPQYGFIEVCKYEDFYDYFVSGSFDFTITAPGFSATQSVEVGQCTQPIQVPAGNVNVTEAPRFPYYVSYISTFPYDRLVTSNLANGTSTVVVPKGDESSETVVSYFNSTHLGNVKVCKTLTPSSTALAGQTFEFTVSSIYDVHSVYVTAGAAGSTTCVIDFYAQPLGTNVSISETAVDNVKVVAVSVAPASRDAGSYPPTANLVIGTGITTATFTNQAYGTLEVCKTAADSSTATQTFYFTVNGGAPFPVHAGHCSPPIAVPAGNAVVAEAALYNFHFVSVATAPIERLVVAGNPATVATPFGGVENETVVTFTNAVDTGQFKICKVSPEPTLQNTYFNFDYSYTVDGVPIKGTATLKPGECSALSGPIPVVDPNGASIPVNIVEGSTPTVEVSNINVINGVLSSYNLATGRACVYVKKGVTTVTYTNVRSPILPV